MTKLRFKLGGSDLYIYPPRHHVSVSESRVGLGIPRQGLLGGGGGWDLSGAQESHTFLGHTQTHSNEIESAAPESVETDVLQ